MHFRRFAFYNRRKVREVGSEMSREIDFTKYDHCISTMPLFQNLVVHQIEVIQHRITEKQFSADTFLYQAGETSEALYLIQEGQVKIYRVSASGKEQVIRVLEQGDFVGEMSLFNDRVYDNYVQAITTTKVCVIHRQDFKEVLLANSQIAWEILAELSNRLTDSEQQTTLITTTSVVARLSNYLLAAYQKQQTPRIQLEATKKNIASYLGMSAESFSRGLTKLTKQQIVSQSAPNIIELLDKHTLEKIANE